MLLIVTIYASKLILSATNCYYLLLKNIIPELYFGFGGIFFMPPSINVEPHIECRKTNRQNLENPLIYGVFRSQGEKMKKIENVFFKLKPLISRSNLNGWSSSLY